MDLIVWCGPVFGPGASPYSGGDIGKVTFPHDTKFLTVPFNGSAGAAIASSARGADGHILPSLIAQHGLGQVSDYERIALCGYSAGHNFMNPVLEADQDLISAAISIDACYAATNPPWTKQGYVDFGKRAAAGEKLMVLVATGASHGGAGYPSSSGSECAGANFDAAAAAAGATIVTIDSRLAVPPAVSERAGSLYLLDYGTATHLVTGQLPHFDVVNHLSEDVFQTYLAPFLAGSTLPGDSGSGGGTDYVRASLVAAIVFGLGYAVLRARNLV